MCVCGASVGWWASGGLETSVVIYFVLLVLLVHDDCGPNQLRTILLNDVSVSVSISNVAAVFLLFYSFLVLFGQQNAVYSCYVANQTNQNCLFVCARHNRLINELMMLLI